MEIAGKKALVTGGALRLGNALTMMLAEAGAEVAVHYNHSETDAFELCDMINNDGGTAFPVCKDLSSPRAAEDLFHELEEMDFLPEILINSASIFDLDGILEADREAFHKNMDINALTPLILTREMAKRIEAGTAVNLLDSRITDYDKLHVPYHVSKQVLFSLTRMLSSELAPRFRVNAVAPGAILPPPEATPAESGKWYERMKEANPLQINGTVDQISSAVRFLLENDFITGQVIFVDGGRHLNGSFYGL